MHQRRSRSQSGQIDGLVTGIPSRRPNSLGTSLSPTHLSSSIPLAVVEDEFKHQARLIAYEQLLNCMFGNHFECMPISGGFSGSSVVKITPYDELLGTRDEAVIVKLDSAANIRTEVANSLLAHKALGDIAARILGEPIYFHNEPDGNDYGAFKMELAGACWYIPEFSSSTSTMINTFKDVIVFESEDAVFSASGALDDLKSESSDHSADFELCINDEGSPEPPRSSLQFNQHKSFASSVHLEGSRPFGSIANIIKELFGLDGSATRSLRRFERTDRTAAPILSSGFARRISQSDPNHPSGSEFLSQRLPLEIKTDQRVLSVLNELLPSSSFNPYSAVNQSLIQVKESLQLLPREFKIIRGFCHGDLNGSNIIIDAMEGMWMIDFATARKLPLTSDLAKLESSFMFEYCFIPIPWTAFLALRDIVACELVAKWFRIEDENLVISIYESSMIDANQVRSETDLDAFLESVVGSSRYGWKDVRRLRARVTTNEDSLSNSIASAIELISHHWIPPNLAASTDYPESSSATPPQLASLQLGIKHSMKMRKYCLSDIAAIWKSVENESDDCIALNRIDVSLVEFSVLLLREMARVIRYEDVAPWMKVVVSESLSRISKLIVDEIHTLVSGPQHGMERAKVEDTRWMLQTGEAGSDCVAPALSRLTSSPAVLSEEARKYTRFLRSRFGFVTDFISGRQLDVLHQCAPFKLLTVISAKTNEEGAPNVILSVDQILCPDNLCLKYLVRSIPGGGKSCFLRQLLVSALDSCDPLIPLLVPICDWTKILSSMSPNTSPLVAWMKSITIDDTNRFNFLMDNLENGKLLLLIDGLDEASETELELICNCIADLDSVRVVATYRKDSLTDSNIFGQMKQKNVFREIEIAPFDFDQRQFVVRARLTSGDSSMLVRFEAFYETFEKSATSYLPGVDSGGLQMIRSPSFLSMLICYWQESILAVSVAANAPSQPPSLPPPSRQVTSSLSRTTTAVMDNLILNRNSSPQWSVGSSPGGTITGGGVGGFSSSSSGPSPTGASIADVYRVALSVLVHRYQVVQQTDRSRVRESSKRLMELLRQIAFKMLLSKSHEISDSDIHPSWSLEWSTLSNQIRQGKFLLLSLSPGKRDVYRFSLPGMIEFLSADHLTSSTVEVESLPLLFDMVSDPTWTSTLSILVEKAPLKLVRIFERKLVRNEWKSIPNSDSLLHVCARLGHSPVFQILNKSSLLESLIHRPNNDSLLPLHEAARMGKAEICRLLLASGADPWASTNAGWCPLHFAASSHNREVCSVLIAAQASPTLPKQPQLARLSLAGLNMGQRILEKTITDSEFMESARLVFPELSYFRGRSDTTPDASASVVAMEPSEIEYRRTMGAMLSVFWICADKYDDFVRPQPESDRLTRDSWKNIRSWVMTRVSLTSPESIDAMLCLMAIHDLGKLKDFRNDLAPDYKDHDAAMKYIIQTTPEVLPSLCRLSEDFQYLVRATLALDFNFGQFVQAENLPSNLINVQDLIATKGDAALAFYLFHIFADMSGIMGAKCLEGSAFMTETMYKNFALGISALERLNANSVVQVYDYFLCVRAEAQGLDVSGVSPENRALVRLACQSRIFDVEQGQALKHAWHSLTPSVRSVLTTHLNRDGITTRPAFLIYYAPAFMENARKNSNGAGLKSAMEFLARIYLSAEQEFTSDPAEASLKSVIVVHIAEAAELVKKLKGSPEMYIDLGYMVESNLKSICFHLSRSGGVRKLNEATLRISPWRVSTQNLPTLEPNAWISNRQELLTLLLSNPSIEACAIRKVYPEIEYFSTLPSLMTRIVKSVSLVACLVSKCADSYAMFLKIGPGSVMVEDRVSRRSWSDIQNMVFLTTEMLDILVTIMVVQSLGSIDRLCQDLNLGKEDKNSTVNILLSYPHVVPSFARLSCSAQSTIVSHLTSSFSLWELVTTEQFTPNRGDDFSFLILLIDLLATRADTYTESMHQAIMTIRKQPNSPKNYLEYRSIGQGIVLGDGLAAQSVASPRSVACPLTETESLAVVRLCCLANIFYPTSGPLVATGWSQLTSLEKDSLATFLTCSEFCWKHLSDFVVACKLNPNIRFNSCLSLLAKLVIQTHGRQSVSLHLLVERAKSHCISLPFECLEFDVGFDGSIVPKALIPVRKDHPLLTELTRQAQDFTTLILTGSMSEQMFEDQLGHVYPELVLRPISVLSVTPDATATPHGKVETDQIEYERLCNSLKGLLWVVLDMYPQFVQHQSSGTLKRSSWIDIVEWVTESCSINNPESLDALIVMLIVSKYGRQDIQNRPELVPSFNRLSDMHKKMILGIVDMKFNMGQFLQCENLPVDLTSLKQFIENCGGSGRIQNGLNFFFVFTFFQMCGLLGAKNSSGCLFMNEDQYRIYRMGVDVIQSNQTESVEVIYNKFLVRHGSTLMDRFRSMEMNALSKLYSLARIRRDFDARKLDSAFDSMSDEERNDLVDYLNRDGLDSNKLAIMLQYAPAFMENMRLNGSIATRSQLKLLLRVFRAVSEYCAANGVSGTVVVSLKTLAFWARDIQFSDSTKQIDEFNLEVQTTSDIYNVFVTHPFIGDKCV